MIRVVSSGTVMQSIAHGQKPLVHVVDVRVTEKNRQRKAKHPLAKMPEMTVNYRNQGSQILDMLDLSTRTRAKTVHLKKYDDTITT